MIKFITKQTYTYVTRFDELKKIYNITAIRDRNIKYNYTIIKKLQILSFYCMVLLRGTKFFDATSDC